MNLDVETSAELHPDHLEDLRRSGLSDETIDAMRCFSATADVIAERTGVNAIRSGGYGIPYLAITDQTGAQYVRWRLHSPVSKMKYVGGRGDDPQLYTPPGLATLPPADFLVVTEGEKKAAKAVQEGIHCVSIQGVSSWGDPDHRATEKSLNQQLSEETAPIPALLRLAGGYERVLVLGDSDLHSNSNAKHGIELLAKSLSARGIRAGIAYCPPAVKRDGDRPQVSKQGLDDWLIADRFNAVRSLPALFRAYEVNRDGITDTSNAMQIGEQFADSLAYSQGIWRWFDEGLWKTDDCSMPLSLVPEIAKVYRAEADRLNYLISKVEAPNRSTKEVDLPAEIDQWCRQIKEAAKALRDAAKQVCNKRGMDSALSIARSHLCVPGDAWDRDSKLLGVNNGAVNLESGELLLAIPELRITRRAGAPYDSARQAPKFMQFLQSVQPDPEVREFLQRLIGYCAIGGGIEQKLFVLVGEGANGKSTFMGQVMGALGTYAVKAPASLIAEQSPDKPRNDLAAVAGARLVSISETPQNLRLDVATVKTLTGNDPITARFLFREFFTFLPTFTVILDTNHAPLLHDNGHSIWRRLRIVEWPVVIPEREQNYRLRYELLQEQPGILNWIIQGAKKYWEDGLAEPAAVREATQKLRGSCDDLSRWMEDCVATGREWCCQSSILYEDFTKWSAGEGTLKTMSQVEFSRRLEALGFQKHKSNGNSMWTGLGLLKQAEQAGRSEGNAGRDSGHLQQMENSTQALVSMRSDLRNPIPRLEQPLVSGGRLI